MVLGLDLREGILLNTMEGFKKSLVSLLFMYVHRNETGHVRVSSIPDSSLGFRSVFSGDKEDIPHCQRHRCGTRRFKFPKVAPFISVMHSKAHSTKHLFLVLGFFLRFCG